MLQFNDDIANKKIASLRLSETERRTAALAAQSGYEYINLQGYTINPEALAIVPESLARAGEFTAFQLIQKTLSIGVKDPHATNTKAAIARLQNEGYTVLIYLVSQSSLEHTWKRYADISNIYAEKKGVFEISAVDIDRLTKQITTIADIRPLLVEIKTANTSYRISQTLELLFAGALALDASDVHIEPEAEAIRVRYRLDGVLHDVAELEKFTYERIMSRLKLLSGMILNNKIAAQDGRFTFDTTNKEVEVRASVIPGAIGESIVMRLLDPTVASFQMARLQLNPHVEAVIERELKKPNGLIITTGPTGSGKTTALYAFLQQVHSEGVKIITIENPVEYKLDGIVQTQIGDDYTFASGLRAILRQDPDVILVGEIRDREVAETAFHSAQTGHLVFSTLHTNSAVAGFARLMDLGVDPRIFGSSLNMMLGQRLIRVLCDDCKQVHTPTATEIRLIKRILETYPHPEELQAIKQIYTATGCDKCERSGYRGRVGIYEAIVMDEAVEEIVLRDPREHMIKEAALPQGIPTLEQDGIIKVLQGVTSLAELERVVELPREQESMAIENSTTFNSDEEYNDDFLRHVV
jgi:type IV pilus assembly protein PilB